MQDTNAVLQQLAGAISKLSVTMEGLHSAAAPVAAKTPVNGEHNGHCHKKMVQNAEDLKAMLETCPIAPLIQDCGVSDILINGPSDIYVDRGGKLEKSNIQFPSHESLMELAENIVHSVGRRIDPKRPLVDARLHDGSRVNIIAPPMALEGLVMSIRKFPQKEISLDTLAENGTITTEMAKFLAICAQCRLNIIISGGTGAGKTVLLNSISRYIPENERVVTIEDTAELRLQQPHVVKLETKEPELMDNRAEEVNMCDLVRNALRMRPDRIIIGEVRGKEAFDMIQAMNTGHDGSMATIHANTPRDAVTRLENMLSATMTGTPILNIRRQIVSAVQLIVQIARRRDGKGGRKVVSICEIIGMEGDMPTLQEIFTLKEVTQKTGEVESVLEWTKILPRHPQVTALLRKEKVFPLKN